MGLPGVAVCLRCTSKMVCTCSGVSFWSARLVRLPLKMGEVRRMSLTPLIADEIQSLPQLFGTAHQIAVGHERHGHVKAFFPEQADGIQGRIKHAFAAPALVVNLGGVVVQTDHRIFRPASLSSRTRSRVS